MRASWSWSSPSPALVGGLPAIALLVAWMADEGAYAPTTWYLGGLVVLGLLVAVLAGLGPTRRPLAGPRLWALAALAAYAVWSYASIAWAQSQSEAFEGSNRTLLYLLVLALFTLLPWTPAALRGALTAFVIAAGGLALVTIVRVAVVDDPTPFFVNARLAAPLGYQNASGAAWSMCAFAGLVLASHRQLNVAIRALLVGLAPVFLGLGLLAQSRGWIVAVPITALVLLAAAPSRLRLAIAMVPTALATAVCAPTLLRIYDRAGGSVGDLRTEAEIARVIASAFDPAARALIMAGMATAIVALILGVLDERSEPSERVRRLANRVAMGLAAAALLAGAVGVVVATDGDPFGRAKSALDSFSDSGTEPTQGAISRFTSLGSSRSDFWRVAFDLFEGHPVGGVGQDNYGAQYLARGRSGETPRWTHSLLLRLLTHTGGVGFLLFCAFVVALLLAARRAARPLARADRAVVVAALAPLAVWLAQGAQDWLWEFPALSGVALGFAGAAVAVADPADPGAAAPSQPGLATKLAVGAALAAAALALTPAWLAARHVDRAPRGAAADPQAALDQLESAEAMNPFGTRAGLVGGVLAARLGREDEAIRRFERVLERDDALWFAHFEVGLLRTPRDREAARASFERARRLHPRAEIVAEALERLRGDKPMTIAEADAALVESVRKVTER